MSESPDNLEWLRAQQARYAAYPKHRGGQLAAREAEFKRAADELQQLRAERENLILSTQNKIEESAEQRARIAALEAENLSLRTKELEYAWPDRATLRAALEARDRLLDELKEWHDDVARRISASKWTGQASQLSSARRPDPEIQMAELKCPHCGETRSSDIDYDWLAYHEQDCELKTLRSKLQDCSKANESLAQMARDVSERQTVLERERDLALGRLEGVRLALAEAFECGYVDEHEAKHADIIARAAAMQRGGK